jgi:hypothetical protein
MVIVLLSAVSMARSQDVGDAQTLFGGNARFQMEDIGFAIAPSIGLTQLDGSTASLFNVRGGLNLNDVVTAGGFYSVTLNQTVPQSELVPGVYMDYWSAGVLLEYTLFAKRLVHLTFPFTAGYGEVQMDNEEGDADLGESNFFQVEPSALLEVNLFKHVRLNIGAGYRFVGPMNYRNFNESDISGQLTGYVGLRFGLFR